MTVRSDDVLSPAPTLGRFRQGVIDLIGDLIIQVHIVALHQRSRVDRRQLAIEDPAFLEMLLLAGDPPVDQGEHDEEGGQGGLKVRTREGYVVRD